METRVAKGTALNSEGRNEKWGGTLSGLKGRSLFQDVTLGDYSKGLGTLHLPPTQREAGVQEFQRPGTTIRPTPSSLDLPGERQSKCTGPTHTTQSGWLPLDSAAFATLMPGWLVRAPLHHHPHSLGELSVGW